MIELSENEKGILEEIQQDIPLVHRPFLEIGDRLAMDESSVISTITELKDKNIIRDISAIYNAKGLGYKSTLVALSTETPDQTALVISGYHAVSHNYYREHHFNIWFTVTIPEEDDFSRVIDSILCDENYESYKILPSLRTFKIGMNLRFKGNNKKKTDNTYSSEIGQIDIDRDLIRTLQNPFPLVSNPWSEIALELGKSEEVLFRDLTLLKKNRVIKRISGVLRHRNAGYGANGMACFCLEEGQVENAGYKAAEYNAVSHCYERPVYEGWPYSLFAMTHGMTRNDCEEIVKEIAREIGASDFLILYSTKEYKKERVKYFLYDIKENKCIQNQKNYSAKQKYVSPEG